MRSIEMSAKTVEAAVQAACEALGVDRDDINVSYEVLEFPARKLFKTIPAKVLVKVEEPEVEEVKPVEAAPAPVEAPAVPAEEAVPAAEPAAEEPAEASVEEDASADEEVPLDIAADPRLQAAVDYLTPIFKLMGVEEFSFTAVKKGEATILRVTGEHMGALIGRRGETMESLSYLASLVINRMEGPYVKLGLDVGGYRNKREDDLSALAKRIADRVIRTGCYYEMEPMNPYERRVLHTALQNHPAVTTHSEGEEPNRRVVIMLKNQPERPEKSADKPQGEKPSRSRRSRRRGPRKPVNPAENQTANEPQETVAAPESPAAVDVLGVEE